MRQDVKYPKKILLVEDDFITAMDAEDTMTSDGSIVKVASNVNTALILIQEDEIDYAVVDFHLGNQNSEPVIEKLNEVEIPFAIVTGAELSELEEIRQRNTTIFRKPVDYRWVIRRLHLGNSTL